jgi:hypothetical protein
LKKNSTSGGSKRVPSATAFRFKYDPVAIRRITTSSGIIRQRRTTIASSAGAAT